MVELVRTYMEQQNIQLAGKKLVLAVSGGADSVCMLDIFHQLQNSLGLELICVHVNHGLRETASRDEEFVRDFSEQRKIPFYVLHTDIAKEAAAHKLSEEEAGRLARYAYLNQIADETGAAYILLAHHRDDCAETMLFNLFRGSGIRGLGGIRPVQGRYLRPLLRVSRSEIEEYLKERGLEYVTDETNASNKYSRNKIRNKIIPMASEICSGASAHIAQAAMEMQEMESYLQQETTKVYRLAVKAEEDKLILLESVYRSFPSLIARRVIYEVITACCESAKDIGRVHVEEVAELFAKQPGKQISLPYDVIALRRSDGISFCKASGGMGEKALSGESREDSKQSEVLAEIGIKCCLGDTLTAWGECVIPDEMENIPQKTYTKWFDYDTINCCPIFRKRREGDYLVIDGHGRKKALNRYFIDEKIPANERDKIWLLADGSHILWVVGHRISAAYKVCRDTKKVVQWSITGVHYDEMKEDESNE